MNLIKGKKAYFDYNTRKEMLESIKYVDLIIPEYTWEQKRDDVIKYDVDIVAMGSDWENDSRFECLRDICDVVYLPRTDGISTTQIKKDLNLGEVSEQSNHKKLILDNKNLGERNE